MRFEQVVHMSMVNVDFGELNVRGMDMDAGGSIDGRGVTRGASLRPSARWVV